MRTPLNLVPSLEAVKYEAPEDQVLGVTSLVVSGPHRDGGTFDAITISTPNGEITIRCEYGRVEIEPTRDFRGRVAVISGRGSRSLELVTLSDN